MSLRRKSCGACFKGRRKCDLTYPVCKRCQKNQKICRYISSPITTPEDTFDVGSSSAVDRPVGETTSADRDFRSPGRLSSQERDLCDMAFNFNLHESRLMEELLYPGIPNLVGNLGKLQPISGSTQTWEWIIEQLKSYPRAFGQHAEMMFIHKQLYRHPVPRTIRAAFGVCAAYACMNEANKHMLFRVLDAEVSELLNPAPGGTLLEDLSRMQAIVLYQTIRLFHGDLTQRTLAELQETLLKARGLQLLRRADNELQGAQRTWEAWIQAESIRRTVVIAFMLYAINSICRHGVCVDLPTLGILPVSTKAALWDSQATYLQYYDQEETMKYLDFTALWVASSPRKLDPFEKMLLVACKGIDRIEALSRPDNSS